MNLSGRILVIIGSSLSIGFGIWHFFVPAAWKWYTYIDGAATELVAAIRAINAFFSLALVLFGLLNILLVHASQPNRFSIIALLAATAFLWVTRVVFQLVFPQGSINAILQYGMLLVFLLVALCYLIPLWIMLSQKSPG